MSALVSAAIGAGFGAVLVLAAADYTLLACMLIVVGLGIVGAYATYVPDKRDDDPTRRHRFGADD